MSNIEYQNRQVFRSFLMGVEGMGSKSMEKLKECFGDDESIYKTDISKIEKVERISKTVVKNFADWRKKTDPYSEFERIMKMGIKFVMPEEDYYPQKLKNIAGAPMGLYYKGKLPANNTPSIAIIGSRSCSDYGKDIGYQFAKELAGAGIDIVSGMAMGIDGFSHRGAIDGKGETYAVLGCGVDICYPYTNKDIYYKIQKHGGIISEFYPSTPPVSGNFPLRNRIISALSDGILVVEAREKSGTMITVDMGLEQGKDVYAIPGKITDKLSEGCNRLIRQGARLITTPEDIIADITAHYGYIVNRRKCGDDNYIMKKSSIPNDKAQQLLNAMGNEIVSVNDLCTELGVEIGTIIRECTRLEMEGLIEQISNGIYRKKINMLQQ